MRQLITLVIVGSIFLVLLALVGRTRSSEDDFARSIAQMVQTSR